MTACGLTSRIQASSQRRRTAQHVEHSLGVSFAGAPGRLQRSISRPAAAVEAAAKPSPRRVGDEERLVFIAGLQASRPSLKKTAVTRPAPEAPPLGGMHRSGCDSANGGIAGSRDSERRPILPNRYASRRNLSEGLLRKRGSRPAQAVDRHPRHEYCKSSTRSGGRRAGLPSALGAGGPAAYRSYLVDPASSHMLVSKIKPCMSKYIQFIL